MERGAVVIVSAQGDYGKPRPAVVIQTGRVAELIDSVTVCFMTSDLTIEGPLRVSVEPGSENGLAVPSQIQVEKIMTFPKAKVRGPVGRLMPAEITKLDQGLLFFLDLLQPVDLSALRPRQP